MGGPSFPITYECHLSVLDPAAEPDMLGFLCQTQRAVAAFFHRNMLLRLVSLYTMWMQNFAKTVMEGILI